MQFWDCHSALRESCWILKLIEFLLWAWYQIQICKERSTRVFMTTPLWRQIVSVRMSELILLFICKHQLTSSKNMWLIKGVFCIYSFLFLARLTKWSSPRDPRKVRIMAIFVHIQIPSKGPIIWQRQSFSFFILLFDKYIYCISPLTLHREPVSHLK